MSAASENVDTFECFTALRGALSSMVGRTDCTLARVAQRAQVDELALTAFVKHHFKSPHGTTVLELQEVRRKCESYSADLKARQAANSPTPMPAVPDTEKMVAPPSSKPVAVFPLDDPAPSRAPNKGAYKPRGLTWYIGRFGEKRGRELFALKQSEPTQEQVRRFEASTSPPPPPLQSQPKVNLPDIPPAPPSMDLQLDQQPKVQVELPVTMARCLLQDLINERRRTADVLARLDVQINKLATDLLPYDGLYRR